MTFYLLYFGGFFAFATEKWLNLSDFLFPEAFELLFS